MGKRIVIKIGDIFEVSFKSVKKYFQYIANDRTQLNSCVIRAFQEEYPINYIPDLKKIASGKIDFHAHVDIKWGIQMRLWRKIGTTDIIGPAIVLFRDCDEDEYVATSKRWFIWKINEPMTFVGELTGENKKAEIGVVKNPNEIIERMRNGQYKYLYPGFE